MQQKQLGKILFLIQFENSTDGIFIYYSLFVAGIILPALIQKNVVRTYKIPSEAMIPTFLIGDYIIVNRFVYKNNKPERGDVVVFEYPKKSSLDYIQRVVAVGGDIVEIRDKKLFINKVQQEEGMAIHQDKSILPVSQSPRDNFGPVTVPENSVFVMGDNRDNSFDSRFWGFVDESKIKGKAMTFYWSWDRENSTVRWDRIGKEIQ